MLSWFYTFKPQITQTRLDNGLYATAIKEINYYLYAQPYESNKNLAFEFLRTNANKGHVPFQYMLIKYHLKSLENPKHSEQDKKRITRLLLKLALTSLILTGVDINILAPNNKNEIRAMFLTDIELQTGYKKILSSLQGQQISRGDIIRETKKWIYAYLKQINLPFISPNWLKLVTQKNNNKIWFENSKEPITTENEDEQTKIIQLRKAMLKVIVQKSPQGAFWVTHYNILFSNTMETDKK